MGRALARLSENFKEKRLAKVAAETFTTCAVEHKHKLLLGPKVKQKFERKTSGELEALASAEAENSKASLTRAVSIVVPARMTKVVGVGRGAVGCAP